VAFQNVVEIAHRVRSGPSPRGSGWSA
jgi:hypothetical protein